MVQDAAGCTSLKLLHVQDGGEILLALLRLLQVRWQVAVEEADHVAEDGEADAHPTLVALHQKAAVSPQRGTTATSLSATHPVAAQPRAGAVRLDVLQEGEVVVLGKHE